MQASDLLCSFFVACESKRLQLLLLCAERVVKCYRVVYRCFECARLWLNRWLCFLLESGPHLKESNASRTRLAAVSRPREYSKHWESSRY